MKKLLITTLILIMLTLTACGSASSGTQAAPGSSSDSLPKVTQLIVGTFKLDGTDNAVTAEQAAELLPLWQVYSELLTSNTAAQEEIDGLVAQIQDTMTVSQMKAITDMNLSQQDVMTVMQKHSTGITSAQKSTTKSSSSSSSSGAGGPPDGGGGMPMGAPPDAGGGMPMGDMSSGSQSSSGNTSTTAGTNSSPAGGGQTLLIEALISYLQSIAVS